MHFKFLVNWKIFVLSKHVYIYLHPLILKESIRISKKHFILAVGRDMNWIFFKLYNNILHRLNMLIIHIIV